MAGDQRDGGLLVGGATRRGQGGPEGPAGQQPRAGRRPLRIGDVTPRDSQRAKVYAAEEFVRTLFDRAAEHGNRVVDFFGTQLTLPPEGRFATAAAVQRYVDDVLTHVGADRPVRVRARRGATAAHYEHSDDGAT